MRFVILFTLLTLSVIVSSQSDFERLNTDNGLSQNDINFIYQDSKGFMWFGTVDGLNRYDGLTIVQYKITTPMEFPIGSNLPFCITEDRNGDLWIGTSDNGLWHFNRKKEQFIQFPMQHDGVRLLADSKISSLYLTNDNQLLVDSKGGLSIVNLTELDKGNYKTIVYDTSPNNKDELLRNLHDMTFVMEDKRGVLWMSSKAGLFQVKGNLFDDIVLNRVNAYYGGMTNGIVEVEGGFLVSLYDGVFFLDYSLNTFKLCDHYFDQFIGSSKGTFFGGNDNGLFELSWDIKNKVLIEVNHFKYEFNNIKSLSKNNITALYEDRYGLLWVGTNGGGLNKLDLNEKKFHHYYQSTEEQSLSYNKVRAMLEDPLGNIWIGTEGGGLSYLRSELTDDYSKGYKQANVATYDGAQNYVYCLENVPGENGSVIFGAGYPLILGIGRVGKSGEIEIDNYTDLKISPAFSIFADSRKNIWLGTYGSGLYKVRYDASKKKLELLANYSNELESQFSLTSDIVRSVIEDEEGNLYIGTDNGLNILPRTEMHREKPIFEHVKYDYNDPNSLAHNYILAMHLDKKNRIWIGTMGGGLCLLNKIKDGRYSFKRYTSKHGLPNDVIKAIEEDERGNLWISSNKGLTKFNPQTEDIRNYTTADGLQGNEFSELASCVRSNGEFLFGGVNGFNSFFPNEIKDNPYASNIEFTNLFVLNDLILPGKEYNGRIVLNQEMPSTDSLKLRFSESSFSVGFSALHYVAPKKIEYKYKLDGFDTDWNVIKGTEPVAKYTNIPPGEYVLKVLATNNDGIWNSVPANLYVEVVPPFWRTIWAFLLYALVLLAMLLFFRRYSIIAVNQKNELMMEHFKKEQVEELVQLKLQFFTNISHEFRTPLTLIQSPLEKLIDKGSEVTNDFRQKSYSLMMKNISILNRLITQLMEFRKLEKGNMPLEVSKGNLYDLVKQVVDAFQEIAQAKNIHFEMKSMYSMMELWFDHDKVEKVLFNLLSNAFKFTKAGGEVDVVVSEEEIDGQEWVKIDVIDNGPGIDKDKLPFLFNRFYQTGSHKLSKVSGTGIGLAYAKNLVTLHKGRLSVQSEPNVETKFSVYLKKGKMHFEKGDFCEQTKSDGQRSVSLNAEVHLANQIKQDDEQEVSLSSNKPTVLIVEDNHDVQELLKDTLEGLYNCVQAYDGKQGLELANQYTPNLIVSDVMMPEMDGFEMCEILKKDEALCHIPVIMLTAKSTDNDKLSGFEGGAEAYMSKPFKIEILLAQIGSILESRSRVMQKFSKNLRVEPKEVTFTSIDEKLIDRLLKVVEENISNPEFTVVQLADEVGMSQSILNKKLKAIIGQTANVFIRTIRLKRAAQLLKLKRHSVTDIVYEVGFNDVKYFRECFRKQFNLTPSEYAKENSETEE
ncbi:hybrid sensor histidine kinase/response regulator transcription factor [Labilibacter marinus]|uniref:hybrid sensor histidine kinase/response regulator transcription factor n=1 Tax=Labilibacter marinus TaxID=1477105 RepID=UPI00082D2713|nr:hybrid sensor histidine kinase/response regulator transcription factor [Labilibacter marinus]